MKKSFLVLTIMLMAGLFLLSALFVGGQEIPAGIDLVTPERIGNPNGKIRLVWSPQQVYSPFSDIAPRIAYLRERLEEWTRAHPNVRIEPVVWGGDNAAFEAKLAADAAIGRAPDAVQMSDNPLYNRWLKPLDAFISKEELDDFFSWTHTIMIDPEDGKLKRIKFNTGTGGLWYRRDLMPEPPRSWDEVIEIGKRLQAQGFEHGFWQPTRQASTLYHMIFPMWSSQGYQLYDENERPTFGDNPEERAAMIEIFSVFKRLVDEGLMPLEVLELTNVMDSATEMDRGRTPFFAGSMWASQLAQVMPEEELDNWALTHYPQLTADAPRSAAAGGWNYGFFAQTPEKLELAVDLILHLYAGREGNAGWNEAGGYPPTRKSVYANYPAFGSRNFQELSVILAVAKPFPSSTTRNIMVTESRNALEAMLLGQLTAEEAVDKFWQDTLNQLD